MAKSIIRAGDGRGWQRVAVPKVRRGDQQGQGGRAAGRTAEEAQGEGGDSGSQGGSAAGEKGHSVAGEEVAQQEGQLVQVFGWAKG